MGPATNTLLRTVGQMMQRFGGDATLVVDSGDSTYDPETSTTVSSVKSYPIRVLAFDYIQRLSGMTVQDGTLIKTGDKQVFIKPDSKVPTPRIGVDKITFEGRNWTVLALKAHNPSGTMPYVYEAYVRA